jgi:hypothetical protein
MMNDVTLSAPAALRAMNTLVWADSVLLNMAEQNQTVSDLREELLELRRAIARQYNGKEA